jgi:two-component system, chemotaxis family, sensor kinase CheA
LHAAAEGAVIPTVLPASAPVLLVSSPSPPTSLPAPAVSLPEPSAPTSAPTPSAAAETPTNTKTASANRNAETDEAHGSAPESMVKVTTTRLDALINTVGELVIAQAMVSQDITKMSGADQRITRNMSHMGKITRELQDLTMAMRMVPIQGVFQKMSRLIRDLARKSGKQIDLKLTGSETELDRNLVEAISDPLIHMVRNAADHGIEDITDRVQAGKTPQGHVELKAYHQAGSVVVEIVDDGRGLNKAKILAKARQAGLIKEDQELTEEETFHLIFAPGLSTAEKVTDVSGRGVGMDVVRRNVEALRGRIDITSVEGKGSTFSIRLPLTLAVIDGLVVKVGAERYILPITSIEQSIRPRREQLSTVQGRGEMCMIRNSLLPLCRLHTLFNVQPRATDPCAALLVLVQDGSRRCCLLVDELLGQQQVVIKSLGEAMAAVPGISGGAILGDGTISLILDVPGLIELADDA